MTSKTTNTSHHSYQNHNVKHKYYGYRHTATSQMSDIAHEVGSVQMPQICVQCKFDTPSDKRGRPLGFIYPSYAANLWEHVLTDCFVRTYVNYTISV